MSNNKQQTAVNIFFDTLVKNGIIKRVPIIELQEALKIEKEQIIDAHFDGQHCNEWGNPPAENYYNETYGGNK